MIQPSTDLEGPAPPPLSTDSKLPARPAYRSSLWLASAVPRPFTRLPAESTRFPCIRTPHQISPRWDTAGDRGARIPTLLRHPLLPATPHDATPRACNANGHPARQPTAPRSAGTDTRMRVRWSSGGGNASLVATCTTLRLADLAHFAAD